MLVARARRWPVPLAGGVLVALLLALAGGREMLGEALDNPERHEPCPLMQLRMRPSSIHLNPSLLAHQNWVEFPVPKTFDGQFVLCLDGRVLEGGSGNLAFPNGHARLNVSTTWVDVLWLRATLDDFRREERWELGLTCTSGWQC